MIVCTCRIPLITLYDRLSDFTPSERINESDAPANALRKQISEREHFKLRFAADACRARNKYNIAVMYNACASGRAHLVPKTAYTRYKNHIYRISN